jgi:hypothetical protein
VLSSSPRLRNSSSPSLFDLGSSYFSRKIMDNFAHATYLLTEQGSKQFACRIRPVFSLGGLTATLQRTAPMIGKNLLFPLPSLAECTTLMLGRYQHVVLFCDGGRSHVEWRRFLNRLFGGCYWEFGSTTAVITICGQVIHVDTEAAGDSQRYSISQDLHVSLDCHCNLHWQSV